MHIVTVDAQPGRTNASPNNGTSEAVAPVAVVIPTYNRGTRVLSTLEKVFACTPAPAEIWVHVDKSDGNLERELMQRFPAVHTISSSQRFGPGGGRHRCLEMCQSPYAVSFDDDSYPVDPDFFDRIHRIFLARPEAAIVQATIWLRNEAPKAREDSLTRTPDFVGCGCGVRLRAYRETRGYLPRPLAYAMEEADLSIQLFAKNWQIYRSGELRVLHDTDFGHREDPAITAAQITNVALFGYLHYPLVLWGWLAIQVANLVKYSIKRNRWRGVLKGLVSIPKDCFAHRQHRRPLPRRVVSDFLRFRKLHSLPQ